MAEVHSNITSLIQLSNFTDDEIFLLKGKNVGIFDATPNKQYVLSVKGELDGNQSTSKEDRAVLHLTKKAERRAVFPVIANVLVLFDLDNEKRSEAKKALY